VHIQRKNLSDLPATLIPEVMKIKQPERYEKPAILTSSEDEFLEYISPANTCGSPAFSGPPFGNAYGYGHGRGHKQ